MEFCDYDDGFRRGTFDRCNGLKMLEDLDPGVIFDAGYLDAWNSNEQKVDPNAVEGETDEEREDRLYEEAGDRAAGAAREMIPELQKIILAVCAKHEGCEEIIWNVVLDEIGSY